MIWRISPSAVRISTLSHTSRHKCFVTAFVLATRSMLLEDSERSLVNLQGLLCHTPSASGTQDSSEGSSSNKPAFLHHKTTAVAVDRAAAWENHTFKNKFSYYYTHTIFEIHYQKKKKAQKSPTTTTTKNQKITPEIHKQNKSSDRMYTRENKARFEMVFLSFHVLLIPASRNLSHLSVSLSINSLLSKELSTSRISFPLSHCSPAWIAAEHFAFWAEHLCSEKKPLLWGVWPEND